MQALNGLNVNINRLNRNLNRNANANANANPAPAAAAAPNTAALPLPHALLSPDLLADITTFALNEAAAGVPAMNGNGNPGPRRPHTQNTTPLPGLFAFAVPFANPFRRLSEPNTSFSSSHQLQNAPMIDDSFIYRFVTLHSTTLRKFWVVGMRCSDDAIRELCERCEKLERVKADYVDEFPVCFLRPLSFCRNGL